MEFSNILSSLATMGDEAWQTARDRDAPVWMRLLSVIALSCFGLLLVTLVIVIAWVIFA